MKAERRLLHDAVRNHLLDEIKSGRLQPGDRVPTENQLMDQFGVSRTTVRRALHDLELIGIIERSAGRGSFVRPPRIEQPLHRLTGFVEDMEAQGLVASARVLTIEEIAAPREVARQLQVPVADPVIHIERVRLANDWPISIDDSYFRKSLGERVAQERLDEIPFYSILEQLYGIPLGDAELVLEATEAGPQIAGLLNIDARASVMRIERTTYGRSRDEVLIFEYLYYRGDRMRYRLQLVR